MNKDEARKLLSVYATGSLTEAERRALFEAALEDQGLFDELGDEAALKEILDEPGTRQRLLAALEISTQPARWWMMRPWPWAAAVLAAGIVVAILSRTPPAPPQEIAQVLKSPEPVASVAAPPVQRKVAPGPPPAPKEALERRDEPQAKPQAADSIQEFGAAARGGAAAGTLSARNEAVTVSAFGFSYSVSPDSLQIMPVVAGYLSVTAAAAVLFPDGAVSAETPVRIQIPAEASNLVIRFSRMPGVVVPPVRRDATSGTVMEVDAPNAGIAIQLFLTRATQ